MVTSSVENLINDQGETVIRLLKVAFSTAKKKFHSKQMMSDIFSKVADEIGVKRTFSELVPEEPWENALNRWQYLIAIYCCVNWRPEYLMIDDRCC